MSATLPTGARRPEPPPQASLLRPGLIAAAALWVYLGVAISWSAGAQVSVAWALLGAYLVPVTLVLESGRRLRVHDRVTPVSLLRTMLLGSLLAAAGSATPDVTAVVGPSPLALRALAGALPAAAETAAIAVAVALIARSTSAPPRAGLFLGGALGAGFAAFAALSAILNVMGALSGVPLPGATPAPAVLEGAVTLQQALLAPITSPVWGALVGAAVSGPRRALAATLAGVILTHLVADAAYVSTSALLGSSATAMAVQLLVTGAVAAPAVALWVRRARALRDDGGDQRAGGGA